MLSFPSASENPAESKPIKINNIQNSCFIFIKNPYFNFTKYMFMLDKFLFLQIFRVKYIAFGVDDGVFSLKSYGCIFAYKI